MKHSFLFALTIGVSVSQTHFAANISTTEFLSHTTTVDSKEAVDLRVADIAKRLKSADASSLALTLEETLSILEQQATCSGLGQWLLMHQGLNGFWTAESILRGGGSNASSFAQWVTSEAPVFRATRERFGIFQEELQALLNAGGKTFVSVPSGTMEDLLTLDVKDLAQFIGVDLDVAAQSWIEEAADRYPGSKAERKFIHANAFSLPDHVKDADVVVSNGLNFYIANDEEVTRLYQSFSDSLRMGGTLITSHLAPPTSAVPHNREALKRQLAIVRDICEMRWQVFRSPELVTNQLADAGLEVQKIIWDSQKMFPTFIAIKVR